MKSCVLFLGGVIPSVAVRQAEEGISPIGSLVVEIVRAAKKNADSQDDTGRKCAFHREGRKIAARYVSSRKRVSASA